MKFKKNDLVQIIGDISGTSLAQCTQARKAGVKGIPEFAHHRAENSALVGKLLSEGMYGVVVKGDISGADVVLTDGRKYYYFSRNLKKATV